MNPDYAAQNAAQRRRLVTLISRLSEVDLVCDLGHGCSVATQLVHLAFWDRYYLAQIETWESQGITLDRADVDAVNEAVRFLSQSIPPRAAVQLVRDAAEAVDRKIEQLAPELARAIDAAGRVRVLRRAIHRREHLDEIEAALSATHDTR
jgi:hypothetical protein